MANRNEWVFNLDNKIFTIVKTKASKALKTKYPDINFTQTSLPADKDTKYPTIYIHSLNGREVGRDLEGDTINAIDYYLQVEVASNKSQADVMNVAKQIAYIFKDMGFEINVFPFADNVTTYYRAVMRVSREITSGDIDNL